MSAVLDFYATPFSKKRYCEAMAWFHGLTIICLECQGFQTCILSLVPKCMFSCNICFLCFPFIFVPFSLAKLSSGLILRCVWHVLVSWINSAFFFTRDVIEFYSEPPMF